MAYRILPDEGTTEALRRIASEQIASALDDIDDDEVDVHETVHEVRKRCKKIRGLIRLFRTSFPAYSDENAAFRDAARRLSGLRDAAALVETCDALERRYGENLSGRPLASIREALVARRDAAADDCDAGDRIASVRGALAGARERLGDWSLEADGFEAIAGGFEKVHRRARNGMRRARETPSVESFHEWRKRVKYHRHQLRILRETWQPVLDPLRDSARQLSDRLGEDHDLAVLRGVVIGEPARFEDATRDLVLGLIDERRKELQAWSFPEARRLLDEKPKRATRRMRRIWEAWRVERRLRSALPEGSAKVA